jgi:ribosomal protein S18 acetylase RimI-like enzyme
MKIRSYQSSDESAVIDLWTRCGLLAPQNNPRTDIQRMIAVAPEWFLVGTLEAEVIATVMVGYDGHRGWVHYLAVAPHCQKAGCGRCIMDHAEALLRELGCPKINLQVRTSNRQVIDFYERIGFSRDDVLSMGKRLVIDEPFNPTTTTNKQPCSN